MTEFHYEGEELELFREAKNWKKYFSGFLRPFIKGKVLEVGAGLGETTAFLFHEGISSWTCLEPDQKFYGRLQQMIANKELPPLVGARPGTIQSLAEDEKFDTILYIDVLEHIEQDRAEMATAAKYLKPGGHLIILSPAYNSLFHSFDKAIGHYRRYTKKTLRKAGKVPGLQEVKMFYLESAGTLLLLINKLLARKKYPTLKQVRFWDRVIVPISRITDKMVFYFFGKTIVGIWQYHE